MNNYQEPVFTKWACRIGAVIVALVGIFALYIILFPGFSFRDRAIRQAEKGMERAVSDARSGVGGGQAIVDSYRSLKYAKSSTAESDGSKIFLGAIACLVIFGFAIYLLLCGSGDIGS